MKILRNIAIFILLIFSLIKLPQAQAIELTAGGQVGALGVAEGNNDTGLGFGAFIQATAFDYLALQIDAMGSEVNNVDIKSLSPTLLWTPVKYDEFRFGLMAGPGFYEVGTDPWRFGLNAGAFAEVSFIKQLPIGLQARYHSVFGGRNNDLWSVFMTVGFRFDVASSGDDW